MKRRRGGKSGYKKSKKSNSYVKKPASASVLVNTDDNIDEAYDAQPHDEMDVEPSSLGSENLTNVSIVDADVPNERPSGKPGHGRVKVKLKSSRMLEPHRSHSDIQTTSDTDKSNQQVTLEAPDVAVSQKEDTAYSDGQTSGAPVKKAGSIKIKSSRGFGFQIEATRDTFASKQSSPPQMMRERSLASSDNEKTTDSHPQNLRQKDPHYNAKELKAALEVIKKVMKMDAAVPFNSPVNPVALGIPDYFDIIDTPMDFGTIRHDLEHSFKYMNSEDVYKDVQYIWGNCFKYNNKGDYIIDLMKRVKKNFDKYWLAAGLYMDPPSSEGIQIEESMQSGWEKHHKSKPKHKRRRYGTEYHKSDCLCAVCVVTRRRKERAQSSIIVDDHLMDNDADRLQEFKLEERSPLGNPCSEDASLSLDHSAYSDANPDEEEAEDEFKMASPELKDSAQPEKQELINNRMELHPNTSGSNLRSQQSLFENGTEVSNQLSQEQEMVSNLQTQPGEQKDKITGQHKGNVMDHHHHQVAENNQRVSTNKHEKEEPLQENHSILQICMSLFPGDEKSIWSGPHSLYRRRVPIRDSPIHTAVASFLKQ